MKVQELMEMMYPEIKIHVLDERKQELFSGTVATIEAEFLTKEIKHVWGQADLDGMKIILKREE